jgi:hypothetical protein
MAILQEAFYQERYTSRAIRDIEPQQKERQPVFSLAKGKADPGLRIGLGAAAGRDWQLAPGVLSRRPGIGST